MSRGCYNLCRVKFRFFYNSMRFYDFITWPLTRYSRLILRIFTAIVCDGGDTSLWTLASWRFQPPASISDHLPSAFYRIAAFASYDEIQFFSSLLFSSFPILFYIDYSLNLNQSNFHWLNQWFAFSLIH